MARPTQPDPSDQHSIDVGHAAFLWRQAEGRRHPRPLSPVPYETWLLIPESRCCHHADAETEIVGHGTHESRPTGTPQQHSIIAGATLFRHWGHVESCRRLHGSKTDETECQQQQCGAGQQRPHRSPTHLRHAEKKGSSYHGRAPRLGAMSSHHNRDAAL